ncbi:Mbov_0392 family ICE element protein [Mycoplasmopsis bovis]|uniref:Mbov_0392 family ICE element protein n=1 Tax=Mycoplasmopsis bovis TaxID=28903 RepID=UPI0032EAF38E
MGRLCDKTSKWWVIKINICQKRKKSNYVRIKTNNEKNFNFKDIAYLTQYASVDITENNFNSIANSYEDELDKLAYVELIKKTIENMTYLPNKVNENIFRSIYYEDDLDKLAGYYKLSTYEKTF